MTSIIPQSPSGGNAVLSISPAIDNAENSALIVRGLGSAVDENPLPCARSLAAQGFCPVDVSG